MPYVGPASPAGALSLSGNALHVALETLPIAAYTCDVDGQIVSFNPPAATLWGREPKLSDPSDRFCGSHKLFTTSGEPVAHHDCWLALALRNEQSYAGQPIVVERPDGTRKYTLATATPLRDGAGRVCGAVNYLHEASAPPQQEAVQLAAPPPQPTLLPEVEQCLQLERELLAGQGLFASFMSNCPISAYMKDEQGRYAFVNRLVEERTGIPVAGWVGKTDFEMLPRELAEEIRKHDVEVLATNRSLTVIEQGCDQQGRHGVWLSVKFPFVDSEGQRFVAGMSIDITDRKDAEEAARHNRARLQLALDAGRMGIWDWDVRTNEVVWSATNELIYGLKVGEFDGNMGTILARVHPDDREWLAQQIADSVDSNERRTRCYRVVWPDGSVHWLESTGITLNDEEGRPLHRIGVTSDITERKLFEENLLNEQNLLRQVIEAQEHERHTMAVSMHDTVIQYAAAAKIHLAAGMCKLGAAPGREKLDPVAVLLFRIVDEGCRLMNLILPPVLEESGIVAALSGLVESSDWTKQNVLLTTDLDRERFEPMNEVAIYRIAREAVVNAETHSQASRVDVELRFADGRLQLEIRDNGIGFTSENSGNAFRGLRAIRERVRILSGTCRIDGRPGQGARIVVELPAALREMP